MLLPNQYGASTILARTYDYSGADCVGHRDHLRDVPWDDVFKLSASAAASEVL